MRKFFKEFKEFIAKGNVFDMAVGLIIATAFNKIVSSMVNDIIMPLVTWATGANSLADLSVVLKETTDATGKITKLTWNYGNFIQTVIDFLIIAFSVFVMVKLVTASRKRLQELDNAIKTQTKKEIREEKKQVKAQARANNVKFKQAWEEHIKAKEEQAKVEAEAKELAEKQKAEEDRKNNPTQEDLLKQILETLQKSK